MLQHHGASDVPRIGNDEAAGLVEVGKSSAGLGMVGHHRVPSRATDQPLQADEDRVRFRSSVALLPIGINGNRIPDEGILALREPPPVPVEGQWPSYSGHRQHQHPTGKALMSEQALKELLIKELQDTYSSETQIIEALPAMVEAASSPQLKQAFETHLRETDGQVKRLEQIFQILRAEPGGNTCEATQGLIEETEEIIDEGLPAEVLDVALIMAAQKVEHYEIASYGSLRTLAETCGMTDVARLLEQTLEEEKATDQKLNQLAEGDINMRAFRAA
ncbi:ferritin-like domain-containing protein [Azospirillum tabaci]|uniref:YciE/YciF ferroxidase family protein n=1 Tax=Azospirillum tabaci TaxID=2752310 RepID=UPI001FE31B74|nr:ferritin-like domain-containing protein [Azospirillum tabaci]